MLYKHRHVTPLWPQANGLVESYMKPLNKAIRTAHAQGQVWQNELSKFLLNYRTTPHTMTKVAPAQLSFIIEWLTMGSQQTRIFTQFLHKRM